MEVTPVQAAFQEQLQYLRLQKELHNYELDNPELTILAIGVTQALEAAVCNAGVLTLTDMNMCLEQMLTSPLDMASRSRLINILRTRLGTKSGKAGDLLRTSTTKPHQTACLLSLRESCK